MSLQITKDDVGKQFVRRDGGVSTVVEYDERRKYALAVYHSEHYIRHLSDGREWAGIETDGDLLYRYEGAIYDPDTGKTEPVVKGFTMKDSGERQKFSSGMERDTSAGKMRPDLIKDGPMYLRWVRWLTLGAAKYSPRNWLKAEGQEEHDRFLESTDRHYTIWFTWHKYRINLEDWENPTTNPLTEDHAAAIFFGVNGVENVSEKLAKSSAA